MRETLIQRLRNLEGMIPHKHKLPSGADTVICSLEAFMQIKELAGEAADAIEELSKPRWIPVTERLPEKWTWVLVCFDGADVPSTGFVNSAGYWIGEDMYTNYDVTHWMPLPEPPKEENE